MQLFIFNFSSYFEKPARYEWDRLNFALRYEVDLLNVFDQIGLMKYVFVKFINLRFRPHSYKNSVMFSGKCCELPKIDKCASGNITTEIRADFSRFILSKIAL